MNDNYSGGLQYAVDIVFCIDVTASMTPVIEQVKQGALTFHDRLQETMAGKSKSISQLRVRVVAFRDFGDNPADALEQSEFLTIPDQRTEFEQFVKGLNASGGGDVPESGLEGLWVAINSDWERGLDRRRHVIVLFTDAPAHALEGNPARGVHSYPQGTPGSMDELYEMWGYSRSQDARMENGAKRLLLFAPDAAPWNVISADWNNTIFLPSQAGDGLEEYEMSEIIDTIANSI
jgi:hypothetical protein